MTIRRATLADIPLILQLLRATPNPPNENEDSIAAIIAAEPTYVDTTAPAIFRMVKRPDRDFLDIPWWTWRGSGEMGPKLLPVFAAAATAFLAEHGQAALAWGIGGSLSGFGETDDTKYADADLRAGVFQAMLKQDLPVNSVIKDRALNGVDSYLQSTLGLLAERAGIDVDAVMG